MTCKKCQKQYVGKTENTLYTRFSNTRSEKKRKIHTPNRKTLPYLVHSYLVHYNLPDHTISDLTITGIEVIHNRQRPTILKRESFWINKLKTLHPNGINAEE